MYVEHISVSSRSLLTEGGKCVCASGNIYTRLTARSFRFFYMHFYRLICLQVYISD